MNNKGKLNHDNDPSTIPPTRWYNPIQLIDTAKRVTESDTFSRNADRRITYTEWENDPKPICFKVDDKQEETNQIWIDFVADTGDGGNATYSVAKTLFEDSLAVLIPADNPIHEQFPDNIQILPRADLLVLGGDLVYPVADERAYKKQFVDIFKAALPIKEIDREAIDKPQDCKTLNRAVIAFPQNHDWYDNLSSFTLLFSHKEKESFLDMKCPQSQSYAAVKLPHNWWLFGLDFGLSEDIDVFQFEYFKKITNAISDNSRIIIEYCEPVWRTTALVGKVRNHNWCYRYEELERIIEDKIGHPIDIRLSGDQHHYRRYTSGDVKSNSHESESHLITCGCGGAFLHPTHGPDDGFKTIYQVRNKHEHLRTYTFSNEEFNDHNTWEKTEYQKKHDYPSIEKSFELSFDNFLFFFKNKWFGLTTAVSYLLIVWANFASLFSNIKSADLEKSNLFEEICYQLPIQWNHDNFSLFENLSCSWRLWSWSTILSPLNALITIFVILGFIYFAVKFNPHSKVWAAILGLLHGCLHFFSIFIIYFSILLLLLEDREPIVDPLEFIYFIKTGAWILFFGWIFGSILMGMYLFTTLNLYRFRVALSAFIITLIYIFLMFAMWFNPFSSMFIITFSAILVAFIWYRGISILEKVIHFLNSRSDEDSNNDLMKWLANFCSSIKDFVFNFKKEILFLHSNEAFSSLRVQNYKGFLRFKITAERLEAFFIGIDEIPKKWVTQDPNKAVPKWKEVNKKITPKLVDYWTVETPPKSSK